MEQDNESDPFESELKYVSRSREEQRPDISELPDAVVVINDELVFLPLPGERVLIERCLVGLLSGAPWLDTKIYIVKAVDEVTGDVALWDPEAQHSAVTNFITGLSKGQTFKVPPPNWDPNVRRSARKKKKRRVKRMVKRMVG